MIKKTNKKKKKNGAIIKNFLITSFGIIAKRYIITVLFYSFAMNELFEHDMNQIPNIKPALVRRVLGLDRTISDERIAKITKELYLKSQQIYKLLETLTKKNNQIRPLIIWQVENNVGKLPPSTFTGLKTSLGLIFTHSSDKNALKLRIASLQRRINNIKNPKEKGYEQ